MVGINAEGTKMTSAPAALPSSKTRTNTTHTHTHTQGQCHKILACVAEMKEWQRGRASLCLRRGSRSDVDHALAYTIAY